MRAGGSTYEHKIKNLIQKKEYIRQMNKPNIMNVLNMLNEGIIRNDKGMMKE